MFDKHKHQFSTQVLLFEFIIGGGFSQQELPDSLAQEGRMMLESVINELAVIPSIQLTVLLDWRFLKIKLPENINIVEVSKEQSVFEVFSAFIDQADAVWIIAPETDLVLKNLSVLVEEKNKVLLNSSSRAISLCSDKLLTAKVLKQQGIKVIKTTVLDQFSPQAMPCSVIKPRDGVGCTGVQLIRHQQAFEEASSQILNPADYIIQPFIEGEILSLSCLFKQGKAWLLCCNQQQVEINQDGFKLIACTVNICHPNNTLYQALMQRVALAIPGLWGYVGIDVIQPESGAPYIVEINPRLTTSYVGVNCAIGFNVAEAVLALQNTDPVIKKINNKQIKVSIS